MHNASTVSFCCSRRKCPSATFDTSGSVTVFENDSKVIFTAEQARALARELVARGYAHGPGTTVCSTDHSPTGGKIR